MGNENAIEVKNVKKKFKVYIDKGSMLKERALHWNRNKYEERWVLNGIDFNIKKGEAVGIVGHNGCGKSTTLKLLTKIIYPDEGQILMNGRVSSLIELGAGFHPDLSGRENIYINASIFGLTRHEIDKRIDDIIDFSELIDFIDNPVRTYSSGMYMRLAFSVAINVDAEILLIDEILAVGDANFQAKCFEKMIEIKKKGTTIVIVSHSLGQIEQICERSIWLHKGLIKAEGAPHVVHRMYLDYMAGVRKHGSKKDATKNNYENFVTIKRVFVTDLDGNDKTKFKPLDSLIVNIEYMVRKPLQSSIVSISITRKDGLYCFGGTSIDENGEGYELSRDGIVKVTLRDVPMQNGEFDISVGFEDAEKNSICFIGNAGSFEILPNVKSEGIILLDSSWEKCD